MLVTFVLRLKPSIIIVSASLAPRKIMLLARLTVCVHVHVPAGIMTVSPSVAELIAFCTWGSVGVLLHETEVMVAAWAGSGETIKSALTSTKLRRNRMENFCILIITGLTHPKNNQ